MDHTRVVIHENILDWLLSGPYFDGDPVKSSARVQAVRVFNRTWDPGEQARAYGRLQSAMSAAFVQSALDLRRIWGG